MPFKNPIASVGGTLVLDTLQSSDFAYTPTPVFDVVGWRLQNAPSSALYAEHIYAEHVRVQTSIGGVATLDLAQAVHNLDRDYPDVDSLDTAVTCTTTFQSLFPGYSRPITKQTILGGGVACYWEITAVCDVQTITAGGGTFVGLLVVTPNDGSPITIPIDLVYAAPNGSRATITQTWVVANIEATLTGGIPDAYIDTSNTVALRFDLLVRGTVAGVYRCNSTHTRIKTTQHTINLSTP